MSSQDHNQGRALGNAGRPNLFGGGAAPRGFTIIEVLVAVSILAMLTTIAWVGVSNMFETRDFMSKRFERFQIIRVSMDRMAREISSAYLAGPEHGGEPIPGEEEEFEEEQEADSEEGDQGDLNQMMRREEVQFGMIGEDDELHFTSLGHTRSIEGEKASEHAEISYYTDNTRDRETGRMVTNLMRREDTTLDDDLSEGGTVYTLVPDIEEVEFEYWDPGPVKLGTMEEMAQGRWDDRWDTTSQEHAGRLPTRVRIKLTLPPQDSHGDEETFTIQTHLDTSEVLEF